MKFGTDIRPIAMNTRFSKLILKLPLLCRVDRKHFHDNMMQELKKSAV